MENEKINLKNLIKTYKYLNLESSILLYREIGLDSFYMLLYFINEQLKYSDSRWFPKSDKDREKEVFLSLYDQNKALKILKNLNIIYTDRRSVPPIIYYRVNFNNITMEVISKYKSTKERKEDKKTNKEKTKENKYVEYWNNIKHVPTKHKDPSTKLYKKASLYFSKLEKGIFIRNIYLDPNFIRNNKISLALVTRKWSEKTIKETLTELSKIYLEGYWPQNKNNLLRNLSLLIYNPILHTSWFLKAHFNGIYLLKGGKNLEKIDYKPFVDKIIKNLPTKKNFSEEDKKIIVEEYLLKFPDYLSSIENIITENLNYWKRKSLIDNIVDIIIFFEKINRKKEINRTFSSIMGYASEPSKEFCKVRSGTPRKFIEEYLVWMKENFYNKTNSNITINCIGLNSNNWSFFINYLINKYDFDL